MNVERGSIFYAALREKGTLEKNRPCLIVQNDLGNRYANNTIVAAILHDTQKALPIHVAIPRSVGGMTKDSIVDCGQLATISKDKLGRMAGHLPEEYMRRVDSALKISLELH